MKPIIMLGMCLLAGVSGHQAPLVPIHCAYPREVCMRIVPVLQTGEHVKRRRLPPDYPGPARLTVVRGVRVGQSDGYCNFVDAQYEQLPGHSQVLTAFDEQTCWGLMAQADWRAKTDSLIRASGCHFESSDGRVTPCVRRTRPMPVYNPTKP
jgi:hypothetical protein